MVLKNALINGEIKSIVVDGGIIKDITSDFTDDGDAVDVNGYEVIPGLIDVHTHGIMGIDTMDADFEKMCRFYASFGTTSFLPTAMTMGYDDLLKVSNARTDFYGANILGFHFEGPYISKKYKGAQNENYIKTPSIEEFRQFNNVKMITVAPEVENGLDFIKEISKDTVVSIGHTDCDYETAVKAVNRGANCLTHTFNAMPPLHHRAPGPIGAAVEKHIFAQIICDGLHIQKSVIISAYRMFGADRMCLISDSVKPAKLPDGKYDSGGLDVFVKDNSIRLEDGTLAGSHACLMDCVKKAIEFGIPKTDAIKMATETPADMLKVNKGKIEKGFDADLLVVDDSLNVLKVIIGGEIINI